MCASPLLGVVLAIVLTVALTAIPRGLVAQSHDITGDIWAEVDSGRIIRGAGATVYVWPEMPAVTSVLDSACAASNADPAAWNVARHALNNRKASDPDNAIVARDLALFRSMAQLPHDAVEADSLGHFAFDSIPPGSYWVEAEVMLKGHLVQWWTRTALMGLPFRIVGSPVGSGLTLGPVELRNSQFCTESKPRVGAAAFATDQRPPTRDHVYGPREVDKPVRVIFSGEPPAYPNPCA